MSHFTVFVTIPEGKTLEQVMLPFHEYECTGIKEYLQFVPLDDGEVEREYAANEDKSITVAQFVRDYYGDHYYFDHAVGKYGRMTNPNKQWDWYEVGGRWSNLFGVCSGELRKMKLSSVAKRNTTRAIVEYDEWHTARENATVADDAIASAKETLSNHWKNYKPAQELYADPKDLALDDEAFKVIEYHLWGADTAIEFHMERNQFIDMKTHKALTHAFIDIFGKWHERGDMGWWGACSNENKNTYDGEFGEFWSFINSLDPSTQCAVVDCHI